MENKTLLTNTAYDILKWVALIALNAIGLCYLSVATIWGLPYGEEINLCADGFFIKGKLKRAERLRIAPLDHGSDDVSRAGAKRGEGSLIGLRSQVDICIVCIVYNRAHLLTPYAPTTFWVLPPATTYPVCLFTKAA